MKNKFKSKKFWLTVVGTLVLTLQFCGVKFPAPKVNEVVGAVCALLVFAGVMYDDTKKEGDENLAENDSGSSLSRSQEDDEDTGGIT